MSAFGFFVHHRSVDLVGMTATTALRDRMGLEDRLISLRRDEVFVLEGDALTEPGPWVEACLHQSHWFNSNKHRYGFYELRPGAIAVAQEGAPWPSDWVGRLAASDRPDLADEQDLAGLDSWLAMPTTPGTQCFSIAAWNLDSGLDGLPSGQWPDKNARLLRAILWSAQVRADSMEAARAIVEGFTVTRSRTDGLLVHPHMEGWASLV